MRAETKDLVRIGHRWFLSFLGEGTGEIPSDPLVICGLAGVGRLVRAARRALESIDSSREPGGPAVPDNVAEDLRDALASPAEILEGYRSEIVE